MDQCNVYARELTHVDLRVPCDPNVQDHRSQILLNSNPISLQLNSIYQFIFVFQRPLNIVAVQILDRYSNFFNATEGKRLFFNI